MSTAPRVTVGTLFSRVSLFAASIALAVLLVVGFRPPDEAALNGGSGTANGSGSGAGAGSTGTGTGSGATGTTGSSSGTTGSGVGATAPAATDSTAAAAAGGSRKVTGPVESTRYGPVEVQITVASGKIVAVTAVALPSGGRSGSISMYASPILADEAMAAQSASIDTVSGATYTSRGYAASLQAAIDQAGI